MSRRKKKARVLSSKQARGGLRLPRWSLIPVLMVALGAGGVIALVQRPAPPPQQRNTSSSEGIGVLPGSVAPDFTISTAGNETFRLSDQQGRVVVLDFLAPG